MLRKARETGGTAGAYLWQPSPTVGVIPGQPDRFLGDPIYSDANIASIASNAKIAVYGDWSAFYIRDVAGLRLERSNDLYFNLNQVAFRGILRTDSNLIDTRALNVLKMSVSGPTTVTHWMSITVRRDLQASPS
jgi:HK97 family phage major capsid protein